MNPIAFNWDGDAMVPLPRFRKTADKQYVVGDIYTLAPVENRSAVSHRHFFACINSAWETLPEDATERFPTPEHLRKYCLIRAGFRDERSIACDSPDEALRVAAFVRPMDGFAVIVTDGPLVTVYTAKSQSIRAMGKAEFQRSKEAVFDQLAKLLGIDPAALMAETAATQPTEKRAA